MRIHYNMTGDRRKSLVGAISHELNTPVKYLGMPSAAYQVGGYTITKIGELIGPDDRDLVSSIREVHGFEAIDETYDEINDEIPDIDQHHPGQYADPNEPPTETMFKQAEAWMEGMPNYKDLSLTEREELGLGREYREDWQGENGMQASDVPEPEGETCQAETGGPEYPDRLTIEMPLTGFCEASLANLEKLIASKASLIQKALDADMLPIKRTADKLRFPWFRPSTAGETLDAYARFIVTLCAAAKAQKRVTAREKLVENEKYALRVFLVRLGMVGIDYKQARRILLENLNGNSAFRDGKPATMEVAIDE